MKKLLSELRWNKRRGKAVYQKMFALKEFGQQTPIAVDKNNHVIFAVDQILCQAARELGWTEIDVAVPKIKRSYCFTISKIADDGIATFSELKQSLEESGWKILTPTEYE